MIRLLGAATGGIRVLGAPTPRGWGNRAQNGIWSGDRAQNDGEGAG